MFLIKKESAGDLAFDTSWLWAKKGNKPKVNKAIVGNALHPLPLWCTVVFIRELVELAQKQRAPLVFVSRDGLLP